MARIRDFLSFSRSFSEWDSSRYALPKGNYWAKDHWSLCQQRLEALIELAMKPTVDLTPENITLLQQMLDLAIDAQEDCPVLHSSQTSYNYRSAWKLWTRRRRRSPFANTFSARTVSRQLSKDNKNVPCVVRFFRQRRRHSFHRLPRMLVLVEKKMKIPLRIWARAVPNSMPCFTFSKVVLTILFVDSSNSWERPNDQINCVLSIYEISGRHSSALGETRFRVREIGRKHDPCPTWCRPWHLQQFPKPHYSPCKSCSLLRRGTRPMSLPH